MHLSRIDLHTESYPTDEHYPFNIEVLRQTEAILLTTPVTFFVGENGAGKSTLLEAVAHRCHIHIWADPEPTRFQPNPFEKKLYHHVSVEWVNGTVPGSFFGSDIFRSYARLVDIWAAADPGQLKYLGGESLLTKSHGQSLMAFFRARYRIPGLYLMDEPETALSPRTQVELLQLLQAMGEAGHAQFIVATHSPILLACPGATIYSFDSIPVERLAYEDTEHYQVYRAFMLNPASYMAAHAGA